MNRIDTTFKKLKEQNKKALIPFITAGDPNYTTTEELVLEMERQGANIIELGVPFSDPVAESPAIQASNLRSLQGGTTLTGIFKMIKKLRTKTQVPLVLMMYINTIYRFGTERFFTLCAETGIDAVIVPDLPLEEHDEIEAYANTHGIYPIHLIAPTSKERIASIAANSKGFLYCVSSTGERSSFGTDMDSFFATVKQYSPVPYAVDFGISTTEQATMIKANCVGIIIGSSIVKIVSQKKENSIPSVGTFVKSLRDALDKA